MNSNIDEGLEVEGGDNENNAIVYPSPHQKKLGSMVVGDGGFESMMKERSRVSYIVHMRYHI